MFRPTRLGVEARFLSLPLVSVSQAPPASLESAPFWGGTRRPFFTLDSERRFRL